MVVLLLRLLLHIGRRLQSLYTAGAGHAGIVIRHEPVAESGVDPGGHVGVVFDIHIDCRELLVVTGWNP